MYRFSLKTDTPYQNALVIKIFREPKMGDIEIMGMQVAHAVGIAEPVEAILNNGVVYRYTPGRPLTAQDLHNPDIIRYTCSFTNLPIRFLL